MPRLTPGQRIVLAAIAIVLVATAPGAFAGVKATPTAPPPIAPNEPAATPPPSRPAIALPRGQLLYENHCQGCHTSVLHVREHRRAKSLDDLRGWILRWSAELKLLWGPEEVDDVLRYLNQRYYKLSPPARRN